MDWKEYESITRYIYETLGKEAGVTIDGHGKDCKVLGKSGVEHQIDVLTSHSDGIHQYKTAIECKYWQDSINKDIIMKVAEIIEDSAISKGVIVSKHGFTDDAIRFAKYKNVGLVELREIEERDWEGRPRILSHKTWRRRPEIIKTIIIPSMFNRSEKNSEEVQPNVMSLIKYNGEEISIRDCIAEFKKELHSQPINKIVRKKIVAPMSQLKNTQSNKIIFIDAFILMGVLTETPIDLKFHPVDEIWLIMKTIFEGKSFTISKKGIIKEDKVNITQ